MTRHSDISSIGPWHTPLTAMLLAATLSACGASSVSTQDLGNSTPAPANNTSDTGSTSEQPPAQSPIDGTAAVDNETSASEAQQNEATTGTDVNAAIAEGPIACGTIDLSARLRILELVNESRASGQYCADEWFPAAPPLSWNDRLEQTAIRHSQDMAEHNIFSHTGTDGSSVSDRATESGYSWSRIGENIAAGQTSAEQAIDGWLASPGHCRNIMEPAFTDMSVACSANPSTEFGSYWTQVLGTQR